jgi:dolichyl-phosphate-mannose-protein mannosyltransferase
MVGLFIVAAVGIAVIMDLWDLLDMKYRLTPKNLAQHFAARAVGLIFVPSMVYLFWFYVHFSILNLSGPGDAYMSAQFQNTLSNSPLRMQSLGKVVPVAINNNKYLTVICNRHNV